jgi:mannose-6-phosphate isomerase-like protein (cupin superfamily)
MEFGLHDTRYALAAGDAMWAPRNHIHSFRNPGTSVLRFLVLAIPTNFERFYRECGLPVERGGQLPKATAESVKRLFVTAPKYGLELFADHRFPNVSSPPAGQPLWVLGEQVTVKLASADTSGQFCICTIETSPEAGPPVHAHRAADEVVYVLSGTYEFRLDDRATTAGPGTTLLVPRSTMHGYRNVGKTAGRLVSIHTPGGFERFLEEAGVPCHDVNAAAPPVDLERVMGMLERHGMDLPR